MDEQVSERRRQQQELYGESVDELARKAEAALGMSVTDLAGVIGLSVPMLSRLLVGERVRIGNPVAIARLTRLREFADQVAAGEAAAEDIPLTLAQIRASSTPAPPPPEPEPASGGQLTRAALDHARAVVGRHVRPTPAYRWPLLEQATGTETWVKHENHTPAGAFKVRGGLTYVDRMRAAGMTPQGLISATRGNHGQSLAFAGRANDLPVVIVVPEGNSPDKNDAMRAFGAELVVHGRDFQDAREYAAALAEERGLLFVPSFHPWLVEGVATYAAELHDDVPGLDVVYVPVGLGSGICANIAVRDLLGLATEVVGVVAERAPTYALSFAAGSPISTESADTLVDGVAVRTPDAEAVRQINAGAARIVQVSEEQALEALALTFRATHNLPEPAGSLALAGLLAERERVAGKRVAVIQTGGNCDYDLLRRALS